MKGMLLALLCLGGCKAPYPTGRCGIVERNPTTLQDGSRWGLVKDMGTGLIVGHVHPGDVVCEWAEGDGFPHWFVNITPNVGSWDDPCNQPRAPRIR